MSSHRGIRPGLAKPLVAILLFALALAVLASPFSAAQAGNNTSRSSVPNKKPGLYIVRMAADPVVAYEGGIAGIPATAPARGKKIDPTSANVQRYVSHLRARHDAALNAVGAGSAKVYDYYYSFNGFAAILTPAQLAALQARSDVVSVWVDERRQTTTDNSGDFLGLNNPNGGLRADLGLKGEDIIVGVIDTGIWPEHPSFSDQADLADRPGASGDARRVYDAPPEGWSGTCQSGEQWSQDDCNTKLIGARYFLDGFGHHGVITHDYKSARDASGHGTHTASTAGGNAGVRASILGADFGVISGMAPRARIAIYKACWNDEGCFSSDLVSAIDAAVADGVDVINYSIGSSVADILGPDDIAFLFAARAGVFAAVSAGNSGPGASTIGSPSGDPWVTTVGASTQNRTFQGSVKLGNNAQYFGASVTGGTGVAPLVDAAAAGSELCFIGALNPTVVTGKIVLCKRGTNARVDKSEAVKRAGGIGMILYNVNDAQALLTDNHWVPSVHINNSNGLAIKAYIQANPAAATAQIAGGERITIPAPWMADFSSRGPNGGAPDIIKPDITAPGVNILAGNTPTAFSGAPGQLFQAISGTSMSSPHVAGIAALLREAHPDWTPAMIKSALMTTAYQSVKKENGTTAADPFDMGAGHLNPNPAVDPGLVYPAGFTQYLGFLCGSTTIVNPTTCATLASRGIPFDPSDLNVPSIGIEALAGRQTIVRTVTNVGPAATYSVRINVPGIDAAVSPSRLTLGQGESASYRVTFTTRHAPLNQWAFGSITWSDDTHTVRSPIAIRPVALAAPAQVSGNGDPISYNITFGYDGTFVAQARGLIPATTFNGLVADDPTNNFNVNNPAGNQGIVTHDVTAPADATYLRISLFDEFTDGNDDIDLFVYRVTPTGLSLVGLSGGGTSDEEVNVSGAALQPGATYRVFVHGWQTDGPDANYTLFTWALGSSSAGNMAVSAPTRAVLGATSPVNLSFSGLTAGTRYLGAVAYSNGTSNIGTTIVRVDP